MTQPQVAPLGRLPTALALICVAIVSAYFLTRGPDEPSPPQPTSEEWSKPYGQTTCADWSNAMTDHDRQVMASVMLQVLHRTEDLDAGLPSYSKSSAYNAAITDACAGSTQLVFTVADRVYDADPRFGP